MIRNIIFDWSGTLVDDLPAVWKATNHVFRQAGLAEMSLETFRAEFRLPFRGFYDRFTPGVPMVQLEAWFHGHFRTVQDSVRELPHARECLEFCREKGVRTFLLSTLHEDHFRAQVGRIGLSEFLERPYLGIWDKRGKIHEILQENRLDPGETMFVGDMEHDIETAHHGGIYSCAVLTGYNTLAQLRRSQPDLIVEHLGELKDLLQKHEMRLPPSTSDSKRAAHEWPIPTVGALIFNMQGQVLMIRTHKWSDRWGIPGGKIKYGETAREALKREIKEETNLDARDIEFVLVQDCIHSPEFYRDAHFLLLNYTCRCREGDAVVLNEEAREFRWVRPEEASRMDLNQPTRVLLEAVVKKALP